MINCIGLLVDLRLQSISPKSVGTKGLIIVTQIVSLAQS